MRDVFVRELSPWGQRRYDYLKNNNPSVINIMRMKGTLVEYLTCIDNDAQEMFEQLTKQLAASEGVNEQLKAADQLEWVRRMNNIGDRAREIVNKELIYA